MLCRLRSVARRQEHQELLQADGADERLRCDTASAARRVSIANGKAPQRCKHMVALSAMC